MTAIPQGRTRRATLVGAMCALVVTGTGLTGCGGEDPDAGTNGVGKLPATQIQSKTRAAADAAPAVRLSGSVVTSGRTYKLDMSLKADGGSGSVTSQGAEFHLLRIGEELYLKASAEFWKHEDGKGSGNGAGKGADGSDTAAADKLGGKYVKVPQGDPSYKRFSGFTDKDVLLDSLLTLHGTLGTEGHYEQAGVRTIRITGDKGSGGTLDVSLEGTPYPLRLVRAGGAGTLTFAAWGKDFALTEPGKDETVDYGKQLPTS
ncbi:hypothetical protein ACGFNV_08320 [Streptomyces sp. NPDC048751]|uniref:hypothetical protein n=1 Tax=Streptomyces sp. NPDC048751 TaxID=3365591 RepID=UPI003720A414